MHSRLVPQRPAGHREKKTLQLLRSRAGTVDRLSVSSADHSRVSGKGRVSLLSIRQIREDFVMAKLVILTLLVVACSTTLLAASVTRPPTLLNDVESEIDDTSTPPIIYSRPHYIECQSSEECEAGHCCVLGMGRFSIPTCQPFQDTEGSCRPFVHRPFNTSVSYPDGAHVLLSGIYRLFCPCAVGLGCDLETSTCQDDSYVYNTVLV